MKNAVTHRCYSPIKLDEGLWLPKIDTMTKNKIELTYGSFSADSGNIVVHNYRYDEKYDLKEEFLGELERALRLDGSFKIGGKSIQTAEIEIHGFLF